MLDVIDKDSYPAVTVIVLNYNGLAHLDDNLGSLMHLEYPLDLVELVLVDNASNDGSPDWVAAQYPGVRILRNDSNLGFAAGNNMGAQIARSEWIAFLNPDTRVASNWLTELIQPALQDPDVVCVASKMLSWDGATIDFADAALNFMGWGCQPGYGSRQINEFNQSKELLFACGGAQLIKREVFLQAGGFDPDFFAYYEDVDLGWRLWLMGHKIMFAPRAIVYHRHHGSWDTVSGIKRWVLSERNTLYTIIKNYDDQNLARILPAALLLTLQRAYLDVRPNLTALSLSQGGSTALRYGWRHYPQQVWNLLQKGAYRQLWQGVRDEAQRRIHVRRTPVTRSTTPSADGQVEVPTIAFSRLVAAHDVQLAWPRLLDTRQTVQALRVRSDGEIFPLFQWALTSNFGDPQFIQAMQLVIARFGLTQVFETDRPHTLLGDSLVGYSHEVSQILLTVMDYISNMSGVPDVQFRLGGPLPREVSRVPSASVVALAEFNQLLWSLPDTSLVGVLTWLADGCHKILKSLESAHD